MGYLDEAASARPVHSSPLAPIGPQATPRQLNANQPFDTQGPAGAAISRLAHFSKGIAEARGGLPDAAAGGGVGEAAEGVAEEAAPLALAAA